VTSTTTASPRTTKRVPMDQRRTRMVVARMTEAEGDLIEQAAADRGVSLSELVRNAALAAAAGRAAS
jgi:uncharacterized protein (DUF1778 family)